VTITGSGFEGTVTVSFGNAPVTATRLDTSSIVVTSPYAGFEAVVDLTVSSELGSTTLPGGFAYANSEPIDTGGGDDSGEQDDTGVSPSGLSGGLIELNLFQIACPDCLGYTSDIDVSAAMQLHAPTSGSWLGWLPNSGSCTLNPSPNVPNGRSLDMGEWAYLTSGSISIGMRKSVSGSDITYKATGLGNEDVARTAQYALTLPEDGDIPAFEMPNALLTPQGFIDIQPYELLYTEIRDAFSARISQSGQLFTWANSGGSGSFVIMVDAYNSQTGSYLGSVLCQGPDNGSMNVPGGYLGGFPVNSLLVVTMVRYQNGSFVRPYDGATIESSAKIGVIGTGILAR
jgi:hypothetical protein